jgi:hypothetical protein
VTTGAEDKDSAYTHKGEQCELDRRPAHLLMAHARSLHLSSDIIGNALRDS